MTIFITILLLVVGLILIVKGADFLVDGASALARRFHVPPIAIGLTVVAFGTSLPELTVSMSSALRGSADMSIGNVIGSNIANILFILGVCVFVGKVVVPKMTLKFELPFLIFITGLLFLLLNNILFGGENMVLSRVDGLVLLAFFVGFLVYVFRLAKNGKTKDEETAAEKHKAIFLVLGMILLGLVMLIGGGTLAVNNAADLARMLGMSEALIGLTILAVGTSAPEIVTSIVATRKGQTELAIGNVVGSNIFNILFILGATSVVKDISFNSDLNADIVFSLIAALLVMIFAFIGKKTLPKWAGIIFLLAYAGYLYFLIGRG